MLRCAQAGTVAALGSVRVKRALTQFALDREVTTHLAREHAADGEALGSLPDQFHPARGKVPRDQEAKVVQRCARMTRKRLGGSGNSNYTPPDAAPPPRRHCEFTKRWFQP